MKEKIIIVLIIMCSVLCGCNLSKTPVENNGVQYEIDKEIIEKMYMTTKIVVNNWNDEQIKSVNDIETITKIIDIFSTGGEVRKDVLTSEGCTYYLMLYDNHDKIIYTISLWRSGYFGIFGSKEYELSNGIKDILNIIEN